MVSGVNRELLDVSFYWPTSPGMSMNTSPQENVVYEFSFTSTAMPSMFCSSYLNSLCDRRSVTIQLLFDKVLV